MLVYEGLLQAPQDGKYEFTAQGEGPFIVRLHDSLLADAGHGYQPGQSVSATAMLQAGSHPIRIYFLKATGEEQKFDLQWRVPGQAMAPVSPGDFRHE